MTGARTERLPARLARGAVASLGLGVGLIHLVAGGLWVNLAVRWDRRLGRRAAGAWCRGLLRVLGVRVERTGRPAPGALLVANHLSWLDIVVLYGTLPETFLSKEELRGWPIVGPAAQRLGTLFIGRGRTGAAERAAESMARRLRAGGRVVFFPEGRIGSGGEVLPFRPRLLRAAHEAGSVVQPVAVTYRWGTATSTAGPLGAMIPEHAVLPSAWWIAGRRITVRLCFLEPLASSPRSRRALAEEARARIVDTLTDQSSCGSAGPSR